jgi:hypothetical protein
LKPENSKVEILPERTPGKGRKISIKLTKGHKNVAPTWTRVP